MENDEKRNISGATKANKTTVGPSLTQPYIDLVDGKQLSPPKDSTARSPASSNYSSLSHGSSPGEPKFPETSPEGLPAKTAVNRSVRDEPVAAVTMMANPEMRDGFGGGVVEEGGGRRRRKPTPVVVRRRTEGGVVAKRAALGFRIIGMVFCLISFSVMVSDKNQGWAFDSFNRYIEFRYCMWMNVIGFAYSAIQACSMAYHLAAGKYVSGNPFRYYLDFALDQMLAYLLISSATSAAMRVDDWKSNWGVDKFPEMANASVAVSFMAFVAFALSSLTSGYLLCTFATS